MRADEIGALRAGVPAWAYGMAAASLEPVGDLLDECVTPDGRDILTVHTANLLVRVAEGER